ncbi:hypothetical protein ACFL6S_01830 [Candidatus Poribacteria bacterium]
MLRSSIALFVFIVMSSLIIASAATSADITAVNLEPVGDITTWPGTPYRWMDIADNLYSDNYQSSFQYDQPVVTLTYYNRNDTFRGTLVAKGLKPNFAYQMKLTGKPTAEWGANGDDWSNEQMGYKGRRWRRQPNPGNARDADYEADKDKPGYVFLGYLLFDYFVTDEDGNATRKFALDNSFHVLWKTRQRTPEVNDSKPTQHTVNAHSTNSAYDTDYETTTVGLYGEWEPGRALPGMARLEPGTYKLQFIVTEESFHSRHSLGGNWTGAMVREDVKFEITPSKEGK